MENNSKNTRVRNVSSDVNQNSRSARVAPSMRTGTSSRVRSVDMSSIETPVRERRSSQASAKTSISNTRRSSAASPSRTSRSASSRVPSSKAAPAKASVRSSSRVSSASAESNAASVRRTASSAGTAVTDTQRISTAGNKNYTDMLAEKKSRNVSPSEKRSSATKSRKPSSKSGSAIGSRFTKLIIILAAVFVVVIIVVAIILSSYLRKYENGQPAHVAESVVEQFASTEKLKAFLEKNASIVKASDNVLDFEDYYYSKIEGKDIGYVTDSSKTTTELSVYNIIADKVPVAEIELTKTGSDSWDLTSIDPSRAFSDIRAYSVLVPDGSKVVVNGIELSEDDISGKGVPEVLEYSAQFIASAPEFTTYTVKLASGDVPSVSGTDASGQPLVFTETDKLFVAGGGASQDFIDSVKDRVETALREYALYFEYLAHDLADYMLPDTDRYISIFGKEGVIDPINTWLFNWDYVNDWEFRELSAKNYTVYANDCFTVDIYYDLYITLNEDGPYGHIDGLDEYNPIMDATWVWVKDSEGQWMISDIIDHY